MSFWVFPRRQIAVGRRFGTLYQFHLQRLDVVYIKPLKMELIQGSETSPNCNLTPGKYPKVHIQLCQYDYKTFFKELMTVHRDNSLWIKPTDALNSKFIGIMSLHVSGSLSAHHQEFLAIHQHLYILCSFYDRCYQFWWPFATSSRMEFHPATGSKRSPQLHKMYQCRCTAMNSWWWAERLPETCRVVIPINLEFSAPVGFIHREG